MRVTGCIFDLGCHGDERYLGSRRRINRRMSIVRGLLMHHLAVRRSGLLESCHRVSAIRARKAPSGESTAYPRSELMWPMRAATEV